jgi:hypothetical protein
MVNKSIHQSKSRLYLYTHTRNNVVFLYDRQHNTALHDTIQQNKIWRNDKNKPAKMSILISQ